MALAAAPPNPHIPLPCQTCGLWLHATSYCIPEEVDDRESPELDPNRPTVLVVGQGPGREEDKSGKIFQNMRWGGAGAFLRPFLEGAEFRWILTNATRCFPGKGKDGRDNKPTAVQSRTCVETFLLPLIEKYRPKVILALGEVAMKAIFGKDSPKSLKAAGTSPILLPGTDIWVLCAYHPVMHRPDKDGGLDLGPVYKTMFQTAERIALEGLGPTQFKWRIVRDPAEAMAIARTVPKRFIWDTEVGAHPKMPDAKTIWFPKAELLCMCVTWRDVNGGLDTALLCDAALRDQRVLEALFTGRRAVGHNVKFDSQALYALADFDVFQHAERVEDTMMRLYLRDQGKTGNGLKGTAMRRWGCRDWSQEVWKEVDQANAKIQANNSIRRSLVRRLGTRRKHLESLRYLGPDRPQDAERKKVWTRARAWLKADMKKGMPAEVPAERPPGSANFSDVPKEPVLYPYCSEDGYWTHRIDDELLPELGGWDDVAYELTLRQIEAACIVERTGLPVDPERMGALSKVVEGHISQLRKTLLTYPQVQEAVRHTKRLRALRDKYGTLTRQHLLESLNPQAASFREELARATGIYDLLPPTEGGGVSVNKEVLKLIAPKTKEEDKKDGVEWEECSVRERIWILFRRLRNLLDLRSKFIVGFGSDGWAVNGWIHTDFKVARVEGIGRATGGEEEGGAITGRWSSTKPNMQNLKKDKVLRSVFLAPPGWVFMESDYDRIEPVVLCEVAGVAGWRVIFNRGLDLYRVIANDVYKMGISLEGPNEEVDERLAQGMTKEIRDGIKTRLLAIMYDESAKSFARKAKVTLAEVEAFFRDFYRAYPEIWEYKQETRRKLLAGEFITTKFGRRRLFELPPRHWKDYEGEFGAQFRKALNVPIQSCASDITCWKAWETMQWIRSAGLQNEIRFGNLVHDSFWILMREEKALEYAAHVRRIQEDMTTLPFEFTVPLRTTVKLGKNLAQMRELKRHELDVFDRQFALAA